MVPPPRNLAADAHECIMGSGSKARRIQGCGAMILAPAVQFPSNPSLAEPMIAFTAPNVIVRHEPFENPHEKRIPHGASTDALGLSPSEAGDSLFLPRARSGERPSRRLA